MRVSAESRRDIAGQEPSPASMVGGRVTIKSPIGREDALVAHTRRNACFFLRENDLGSM